MLTTALTNGLLGAGTGAYVGSQRDNVGAGLGALVGGGAGTLLGLLPGYWVKKMIKDKEYRKKFHRSPFTRGVLSHIASNPVDNLTNLGLPALLGGGIGALGHTGNSRTWDTFWTGGGPAGALASALDHAYNGPSEDLDKGKKRSA
jgi:hypothetical protein